MSKDAFTAQYKDVATRAAEQLGTDPAVLLAQWGLETGWGKSIIPGTNNLGNIKDFSGSGVAAKDNQTKSVDKYRQYATANDFADDFVSLIKRRYPKAVGQKSARGFAGALKAGGYAEDADYVDKIAKFAGDTSVTPRQIDNAVSTPNAFYATLARETASMIVRPEPGWQVKAQRRREQEFEDTKLRAEAAPTGLEMFGGALSTATTGSIVSAVQEMIYGPKFAPDPAFKPDWTLAPQDTDSDLMEQIANSKSKAEQDHVLAKFAEDKMRQSVVMSRGRETGLALSFAAEIADPINWVVPFAAQRSLAVAGMGSLTLAQQGRTGASVASAVAENLLGGTAVEAVRQGLTGKFDATNLGISLVADSLLGAAVGGLTVRSSMQAAEEITQRAAHSLIVSEERLAAKAEMNLGPNATPEAIRTEMNRVRVEDTKARVVEAASDINPSRKFPEPAQFDAEAAPTIKPVADFPTQESLITRTADLQPGGKHEGAIKAYTNGMASTPDEIHALAPGLHYADSVLADTFKPSTDTAIRLMRKVLPKDFRIVVSTGDIPMPQADGTVRNANGAALQVSDRAALIRIDPNLPAGEQLRTMVHEVGHVVFNTHLSKLADADKAKLASAFARFLDETDPAAQRAQRYSLTNSGQMADLPNPPKADTAYDRDWDEFSAEQFVKYLERDAMKDNKLGLSKSVIQQVKDAIELALKWLTFAKREGAPVTNEYKAFFDTLVNSAEVQAARGTLSLPSSGRLAQAAQPADVVNDFLTDPDAIRFGLTNIPVSTPEERAHAQAVLALHKKAAEWEKANPYDAAWEANVNNLADNNVFNVASTGLIMLKSKSPLVRMLASELVEDASGVAGKRGATAAISKYITERFMKGNVENDLEAAYGFWNKDGNLKDELISGGKRAEFNKLVASEIEARGSAGGNVTTDANIKAAADALEAAYTRIANEQKKYKTLGWEGLPSSSVGYMPHRMSPKAVMNLTNEQRQILHSALVDQFVTIEGWDITFSDKLASAYIKRIRDKASGDYGSLVGGSNSSTASMVEDALRSMAVPEETIKQQMEKFTKGAANFTKGRIKLDLNRVYETSTGSFRLLDIFDTDQISLIRNQAGRASGEVALTKFGVRGKPGLKLLRDAMTYGEDGKQAAVREVEAFDQVGAEFMNEPFGSHGGKWMERATAANTLVRLGGIAFNQLAESINGVFHVGVLRTLDSISSIPRLRQEIIALSKGEKVDNSIIGSIEHTGGAEFGTDAYKFVMPYDSPDHLYPTYGQDTLTLTDRLLRGGGHLQSKLSGWRLIHSAQQRGMAEQIVHKMMRYVREGGEDVALRDFGITPEVQAYLKANLDSIATFDSNGRLVRFDITKLEDADLREQVIQSVWRGTQQIIQGTFIGERGKWAHDGWMKMLTQFRTFSITSMEKQWGRQRNQRGSTAAYGMLIGSMSMAVPIYMARVYANSVGRPDQEEYIDQKLAPQQLARATLNYVAMSGMAGDFLDLTSSLLPEEVGIKPTGGRAGVESTFVGNYVLPAASLVDDVFKYAQSPTELDELMRILPGSRVPYLLPLVNSAKD